MTHYIGENSTFDIDMELIEMFVNCYKEGTEIQHEAVYFYYLSQALHYWSTLDKFINENEWYNEVYDEEIYGTDEIITSLKERRKKRAQLYSINTDNMLESIAQKEYPIPNNNLFQKKYTLEEYDIANSLYTRFKYIQNYFENYEEIFNQRLKLYKDNFERTKKYSYNDTYNLFMMIAELRCGNFNISNPFYGGSNDNFLLTNRTGFFNINSYMYAIINGVVILGLPVNISSYDDKIGCPKVFFEHDEIHAQDLQLDIDNDAIIYYTILNDNNLNKEEKEELIFAMWFNMHEISSDSYIYVQDYMENVEDDPGLTDYRYPSESEIEVFLPHTTKTPNEIIHNYFQYAYNLVGSN